MGFALIEGFIKSTEVIPGDINACDKDERIVSALKKLGVNAYTKEAPVVKDSDIIILAVKPKHVEDVLTGIKDNTRGKLIISIAAGVTTSFIEKHLEYARVIRVMPNTLVLVQQMAAAYCLGKNATKEDEKYVKELFGSMGVIFKVDDEEMMHAVTGLSGSGPAFVYYFIDILAKERSKELVAKEFKDATKQSDASINLIKGMADAGDELGLDKDIALKLAEQTTLGAAEMILKTGKPAQELIEMVRSPGGTTNAGIKAIENSGIYISEQSTPANIYKLSNSAVKAATKRSKELAK